MRELKEVKPCPFCGSKKIIITPVDSDGEIVDRYDPEGYGMIACQDCGCNFVIDALRCTRTEMYSNLKKLWEHRSQACRCADRGRVCPTTQEMCDKYGVCDITGCPNGAVII